MAVAAIIWAALVYRRHSLDELAEKRTVQSKKISKRVGFVEIKTNDLLTMDNKCHHLVVNNRQKKDCVVLRIR